MVNNDPISENEVYDERQNMIRSQLTKRALWLFVITSGINLIIMECGLQWCESRVLSTAFFGAAAHLYWTAANIKRGSLFGLHGTAPIVSQTGFFFADGLFIPIVILTDDSNTDVAANFFHKERHGVRILYVGAGQRASACGGDSYGGERSQLQEKGERK